MTPNPYDELLLTELAKAASTMAWDLRKQSPRTPAERQALADNCAWLLLTLSRAIEPGHYMPGQPENHLNANPDRMVDAFAAWSATGCNAVRYHSLRRAAEFALGSEGKRFLTSWPTYTIDDAGLVHNVAYGNDDVLLESLRRVDDERQSRRRRA